MKNKKQTLKVVCFNHSWLTPIRHGIQSGHALVELVRKYQKLDLKTTVQQSKMVVKWADKDKTVVVLDGGVTPNLNKIKKLIPKELPFAIFREPDCGNMVTSIAVLVPSDYWEQQVSEDKDKKSLARKLKFVMLMNESKLAR